MADLTLLEVSGITNFEMGDVGVDGAMGAVLTAYNEIKDDTMVLGFTPPDQTEVNIYQSDTPYDVLLSGTLATIAAEFLGLKLSEVVEFAGGTFTAGVGGLRDTWAAPVIIPKIYQSIRFDTVDVNGETVTYNFPRVLLGTGQDGTISKTDILGLQVTFNIVTPFTAGVAQPSRFVQGEVIL